jgi:hypothetical protein
MLSSLSTPPSSDAADANYVLGQTGDTVVYIFPTGDALMNRDADAAPALVDHQRQTAQPSPAPDEAALVDQWLAEGKLTIAQIQVARHDQAALGMSLTEALTLRGWI